MSQTTDQPRTPRSIRQKRILDVAADQPEASLAAIAVEIPSATSDLVEDVLEQYGDPAENDQEATNTLNESAMATEPTPPKLDELPVKQRELIEAIAEHPDATQQELAERLDVSAPTVSNRVNAIDGVDWESRQDFIAKILETDQTDTTRDTPMNEPSTMESDSTDKPAADDHLSERVTDLEERVERLPTAAASNTVFEQPELAHKVMHACLESEAISEEEELQILKALLG